MNDMCTCHHTSAWHLGAQVAGQFKQRRECVVDGCPCREFVNKEGA